MTSKLLRKGSPSVWYSSRNRTSPNVLLPKPRPLKLGTLDASSAKSQKMKTSPRPILQLSQF